MANTSAVVWLGLFSQVDVVDTGMVSCSHRSSSSDGASVGGTVRLKMLYGE